MIFIPILNPKIELSAFSRSAEPALPSLNPSWTHLTDHAVSYARMRWESCSALGLFACHLAVAYRRGRLRAFLVAACMIPENMQNFVCFIIMKIVTSYFSFLINRSGTIVGKRFYTSHLKRSPRDRVEHSGVLPGAKLHAEHRWEWSNNQLVT